MTAMASHATVISAVTAAACWQRVGASILLAATAQAQQQLPQLPMAAGC